MPDTNQTPATVPAQREAADPVKKSTPIVVALVVIVGLIGIANIFEPCRRQETVCSAERGRGRRFDLGEGLKLEILDNTREPRPLELHKLGDRTHLVIEVPDIHLARSGLASFEHF